MSIKDSIGWAQATCNPLGFGCYGPGGTPDDPQHCWYCYAKKMAHRNLRGCQLCAEFKPHWHPEQLEKLKKKKPTTFFMQSMGDLFHYYTPTQLIYNTFDAALKNPQHVYLWLTQYPSNMVATHWHWRQLRYEYAYDPPKNWWFGVTITNNNDLIDKVSRLPGDTLNNYISFEPLMGRIELKNLEEEDIDKIGWIIVGAMTGCGKKNVVPESDWIHEICVFAAKHNIPVFLKKNLNKVFGVEEGILLRKEIPERIKFHLKGGKEDV